MSSQPTNKLINSTSPYLLQHAHNPVNWQPWSNEALQEAQEKDKLLLISIGYAACHWCHVMEQESFEDKEVAELMNHHFICIKVDREELPDIDHYYMTSIHLMQKSGGWPLNIIALPDGRTIWGGTYFPKNIWMRNIESVANFYKTNRQKTLEYAENLQNGVAAILEGVEQSGLCSIDRKKFEESISQWKKTLDYYLGGTKSAPKFMMPTALNFLLNYAYQTNDEKLQKYVETTLVKMANGGLYDQIGGGFARYSVDIAWKVPHFEKMLYDNGQLVELYSKAYKLFKRKQFKNVVYQTVDFLQRELMNPQNGYYSSLDADSDGEEGKFYVWKKSELQNIIKEDYELFEDYYNVNEKGYWEEGNYILLKDGSDEEFSKRNNLNVSKLEEKVQRWNKILLKQREKRIRPALDDKTLTSWNALVISGLIEAFNAFDDKQFLDLALKNYEFLKSNIWLENHQLYHSWKERKATISGYLEDYALLIKASLQLFEVTSERIYLVDAEDLTSYAIENFYNREKGNFYFSQIDKSSVNNFYQNEDNVIPAANSVMANNLNTLFLLTSNFTYKEIVKSMSKLILPGFYQYSSVYSNWGNLYLQQLENHYELVVIGQEAKKNIKQLNKEYLPNVQLFFSEQASNIPIFKDRYNRNNTLFYICEQSACQQPVKSMEEALELIKG